MKLLFSSVALALFVLVNLLAGSTPVARADNRNLIVQTTSSDCGPAALATLLNFYLEIPATEKEMERLSGVNQAVGTTLLGLEKAAKAKGCAADSFRMDYASLQEQLNTFAAPVIVNLMNQEPHFAVVLQANDDYVYLADPAFGNVVYRKNDFLYHWAAPVKAARTETDKTTDSVPGSTPQENAPLQSTPAPEGFVFLAVGSDPRKGRELRQEMVKRLQRQIQNLQTSRAPIAVFRR
jgi:predicted double-glycine peptidase